MENYRAIWEARYQETFAGVTTLQEFLEKFDSYVQNNDGIDEWLSDIHESLGQQPFYGELLTAAREWLIQPTETWPEGFTQSLEWSEADQIGEFLECRLFLD